MLGTLADHSPAIDPCRISGKIVEGKGNATVEEFLAFAIEYAEFLELFFDVAFFGQNVQQSADGKADFVIGEEPGIGNASFFQVFPAPWIFTEGGMIKGYLELFIF